MKRLAIATIPILLLLLIAVAARQPGGALAQGASGDEALPKGFKVTPVLKSSQTASNMAIEYPRGKTEIVSVIGELEPGGRTALHQHPVPVFVYAIGGTLTVQAQGGPARESSSWWCLPESRESRPASARSRRGHPDTASSPSR